jgi:hypothetical protein
VRLQDNILGGSSDEREHLPRSQDVCHGNPCQRQFESDPPVRRIGNLKLTHFGFSSALVQLVPLAADGDCGRAMIPARRLSLSR